VIAQYRDRARGLGNHQRVARGQNEYIGGIAQFGRHRRDRRRAREIVRIVPVGIHRRLAVGGVRIGGAQRLRKGDVIAIQDPFKPDLLGEFRHLDQLIGFDPADILPEFHCSPRT
jgi:hypothetical protein